MANIIGVSDVGTLTAMISELSKYIGVCSIERLTAIAAPAATLVFL